MKRFAIFLAAFAAVISSAVELSGNKEFISLNWKNTMARPVFTVSFKVRMDKKNMVIPAHVKNRGRVLFNLSCQPKTVPGLLSMKMFFQMAAHPTGGYAGIQAEGVDFKGNNEKIRYNVYWRAANSQVPTDEFVTVTLVYADGRFDAYLNLQNHAALHKLMTHTVGFAAPEFKMTFGGSGARYNVPCAIKDIAVFDRALTSEEVKHLVSNGNPKDIVGLLAHYPMEKNAVPAVSSPQISVKLHKRKK